MDVTLIDGERVRHAVDVDLEVRCLSMGCGGRQPHVVSVEVFDLRVAAGGGRGRRNHRVVGEHVHGRCLRLDCVVILLPHRLARTRGDLEKGPPALRICMETTRASSLWQAAAVRPEPERMPSLRCGVPTRGVVSHVFGIARVLLY